MSVSFDSQFNGMGIINYKKNILIKDINFDLLRPQLLIMKKIRLTSSSSIDKALFKDLFRRSSTIKSVFSIMGDDLKGFKNGEDNYVWSPAIETNLNNCVNFVSNKKQHYMCMMFGENTFSKQVYEKCGNMTVEEYFGSDIYKQLMKVVVRCAQILVYELALRGKFIVSNISEDKQSMSIGEMYTKPRMVNLSETDYVVINGFGKKFNPTYFQLFNHCTDYETAKLLPKVYFDKISVVKKTKNATFKNGVHQIFTKYPPFQHNGTKKFDVQNPSDIIWSLTKAKSEWSFKKQKLWDQNTVDYKINKIFT